MKGSLTMSSTSMLKLPDGMGQSPLAEGHRHDLYPVLDPALLCGEKNLPGHHSLVPVRQSATTTAAEALLQHSRRTWWQGQAVSNVKVTPKSNVNKQKTKPRSPGTSPPSEEHNEVCVISQLFVTCNSASLHSTAWAPGNDGQQAGVGRF